MKVEISEWKISPCNQQAMHIVGGDVAIFVCRHQPFEWERKQDLEKDMEQPVKVNESKYEALRATIRVFDNPDRMKSSVAVGRTGSKQTGSNNPMFQWEGPSRNGTLSAHPMCRLSEGAGGKYLLLLLPINTSLFR